MASCAAIATAVAVGACGSGVPSDAVATVGSAHVLDTQVAHWLIVANDSSYVGTGTAAPPVPLPPDYTACVANERASASSAAASDDTSALKEECAARYKQLIQTVLELLVQAIWIQGEAYDRGAHVSTATVDKTYNTERKKEFPTTSSLDTYLAESGETVADLEWTVRLNLLRTKIVDKVEAAAKHVSNAQIAQFYKSHASEYTTPERRNLELVLVSTAATAAKVKSLLAGGASYATVAKEYSIDPTTKNSGGVTDGVEPSEETALFSKAIFAAPVGTLEGPVKTAFGYYVFTVTKSTPSSTQSLASARTAIKNELATTRETAALDALNTSFVKKWKGRTKCASADLIAAICSNAPAVSATGSSGTTGATVTGGSTASDGSTGSTG